MHFLLPLENDPSVNPPVALYGLRPDKGGLPLKRIRYISRFAHPLSREEIEAITQKSQSNNASRDITGMLVATGDLFYQVLEGPEEEVDALYSRIAADPRHEQVLVLDSESGDFDRMCPDWAMRKVDLSRAAAGQTGPVRMLLEMVFVQRKLANDALKSLDDYTWDRLLAAELEAAGD